MLELEPDGGDEPTLPDDGVVLVLPFGAGWLVDVLLCGLVGALAGLPESLTSAIMPQAIKPTIIITTIAKITQRSQAGRRLDWGVNSGGRG